MKTMMEINILQNLPVVKQSSYNMLHPHFSNQQNHYVAWDLLVVNIPIQ